MRDGGGNVLLCSEGDKIGGSSNNYGEKNKKTSGVGVGRVENGDGKEKKFFSGLVFVCFFSFLCFVLFCFVCLFFIFFFL